MESFIERFKNKTSTIDKKGINVVIAKPANPIVKNGQIDASSRSSERPRMKRYLALDQHTLPRNKGIIKIFRSYSDFLLLVIKLLYKL